MTNLDPENAISFSLDFFKLTNVLPTKANEGPYNIQNTLFNKQVYIYLAPLKNHDWQW